MSYQAFGLRWHSRDLDLPELPWGPADSSGSEDVQIVEEEPDHWDMPGAESMAWPGLWVKPGLLQLEIKGVGCFRATEGKHLAWSRCSSEVPDLSLIHI